VFTLLFSLYQIAKLVDNPENAPYTVQKAKNKMKRYTYVPCCSSSNDPNNQLIVYVHPSSGLFSTQHPYVAYKEIVSTSRPYMKGVSAIDPSWLSRLAGPSLCKLGKPLETPPPK